MNIYDQLIELNTRDGVAPRILPAIQELIEKQIGFGLFRQQEDLVLARDRIVQDLKDYAESNNINTVVLGMSGGIDSALTASLFKSAGYRVIGMTLPIHQEPSETMRGVEACDALGIEHVEEDLSDAFDFMSKKLELDNLGDGGHAVKVRLGNIRARLRMLTLYNMAAREGGFVASTDNFSELSAGFWTLHGDVGDVAPIQSLTKSWEVPQLALIQGVPESIINAKPTDGLGVANGDEDQFGFSYLEFDAILFALIRNIEFDQSSPEVQDLVAKVEQRIKSTIYKRANPHNLEHPLEGYTRYFELEQYDKPTPQIGE